MNERPDSPKTPASSHDEAAMPPPTDESTDRRPAALVVPLVAALALGAWWALGRDGGPAGGDGAARSEARGEDAGRGTLGEIEDPAATRVPAESPAPAAPALDAPASAPERRIRRSLQLVDRLDGAPVPHMLVSLSAESAASGASIHVEARTDGTGWLELPEAIDVTSSGVLVTKDEVPSMVSTPELIGLDEVTSDRVPVAVGPTYFLEPELGIDPGLLFAALRPVASGGEPREANARIREGERPWLRFSADATELAETGPFELELTDREGFYRAVARVPRCAGIEPTPVRFDVTRGGAIHFGLKTVGKGVIPFGQRVRLEPLAGGEPFVTEAFRTNLPRVSGALDVPHVPPGRYRWSLTGDGTGPGGEVTVVLDELTSVEIEPDRALPSFDATIAIDTTAAGDVDPEQWTYRFSPADRPGLRMACYPQPTPEGSRTAYHVRLDGLTPGQWLLWVDAGDGFRVDPAPAPFDRRTPSIAVAVRRL